MNKLENNSSNLQTISRVSKKTKVT